MVTEHFHKALGQPSQHWLPTWLDLFLPEEDKTKGELKEASKAEKRALRGERWWRSR